MKPSLQVLRARFSEITARAVRTACENLTEPDQRVSDAVDVRQELDLRIGEEGAMGVGGRGLGAHPAVTLAICGVLLPSVLSTRGSLHQVPDAATAEDLPRGAGGAAYQLRQLPVPHPGVRGGEVQSHSGICAGSLPQDPRCGPGPVGQPGCWSRGWFVPHRLRPLVMCLRWLLLSL